MLMIPSAFTFRREQSRLFETMRLIVIFIDTFGVAFQSLRGASVTVEEPVARLVSKAYPLDVLVRVYSAVVYLVNNKEIDTIELWLSEKTPSPPYTHNVPATSPIFADLIGLAYVKFYEAYLPFIQTKYSSHAKNWPSIFQFAWLLRNAIVHHEGRVNFKNPNFPPITWRGMTYSPQDKGKEMIGAHFHAADCIIFLIELSAQLDTDDAPKV